MYVLPLESVYGVFGAAGQRLVEVGVVGVVEEGTTGAVVVSGETGVVGPTDDGPIDDGPTDGEPTDGEPTDDGPTNDGPADDGPVDDGPAEVDSTGAVALTGVVGTPGVVDAIGVVAPTKVVGSTGLVTGLVPVLVFTILEPKESLVVIKVVKVFGIVDCTGAVIVPVVICTTVEPSEFVVVTWNTEVDGPLDETHKNKVPSRSAPQHSATLPLQDVQVFPSGSAARLALVVPQLHVSPRSHQCRPLRMG